MTHSRNSITLEEWFDSQSKISSQQLTELLSRLTPAFQQLLRRMQIKENLEPLFESVYLPLACWVITKQEQKGAPLVLGINGSQGSGKSTLCQILAMILNEGFGKKVAGFSIDDLYKTRAERVKLSEEIHPLFKTRGVPGTHDVEMGLKLLEQLRENGEVLIPVFDKALDDRAEKNLWHTISAPVDIIIFEGWCVGAHPQPEKLLGQSVNQLEKEEDSDLTWRRFVNDALKGNYSQLFSQIDTLIMLKIPSFESVLEWRTLQEKKLAGKAGKGDNRIMDDGALRRFIMHYERLTRHMLEEMPDRADLTLLIDKRHQICDTTLTAQ